MNNKENIPKTLTWWHNAADLGDVSAEYMLSVIYTYSRHFKNSANTLPMTVTKNHSHDNIQTRLDSLDDKINQNSAITWYRKSAREGNAVSQTILGMRYTTGKGVPQCHQTALHWYQKAASQNHGDAQYLLGMSYANGAGTPLNYKMAFIWFSLAAANGVKEADISKNKIIGFLTKDTLAVTQEVITTLSLTQ